MRELTARVENTIHASPSEVWVALTTPATLKKFFFGAEISTDWVVGSAIRMGRWLPEAVTFVNENIASLQRVPTAYFTVCATLREDTSANRAKVAGFIEPVRAVLTPAAEGYFAGKVDPDKLSFLENIALKAKSVPQGDFRDWNKITNWAQGTYAQISA